MSAANPETRDLAVLYDLVRRTRAGVLDWLERLPAEVFVHERDDVAFGSLRVIYAHVAATYLGWVGATGLGRPEASMRVRPRDAAELRAAFERVDATVAEALATFGDLDAPLPWTDPEGREETLSRRWLLLHPITHEFHHKGQALALARLLGHPHPGAPDTDLVAP